MYIDTPCDQALLVMRVHVAPWSVDFHTSFDIPSSVFPPVTSMELSGKAKVL
jgi:hypothetical protein